MIVEYAGKEIQYESEGELGISRAQGIDGNEAVDALANL